MLSINRKSGSKKKNEAEWKQLPAKKTHSNGINDFYLFWKGENLYNIEIDDESKNVLQQR